MNNFNQGLTSLSITWFDENNNMEFIDFYELNKTQKLYQPFSNIIYYKELNPVDLGRLKDKINLTDEQFNNVLGIEQYTNNNIISVNNIFLYLSIISPDNTSKGFLTYAANVPPFILSPEIILNVLLRY